MALAGVLLALLDLLAGFVMWVVDRVRKRELDVEFNGQLGGDTDGAMFLGVRVMNDEGTRARGVIVSVYCGGVYHSEAPPLNVPPHGEAVAQVRVSPPIVTGEMLRGRPTFAGLLSACARSGRTRVCCDWPY
jgi:hypothetical protein